MPAFVINPDALYDDSALVLALDVPSSSLARARRSGMLQYRRLGHRILYLGKWLLDWLNSVETTAIAPTGASRG
jgi:hypothetical protein